MNKEDQDNRFFNQKKEKNKGDEQKQQEIKRMS